jgi:hypothetical protein
LEERLERCEEEATREGIKEEEVEVLEEEEEEGAKAPNKRLILSEFSEFSSAVSSRSKRAFLLRGVGKSLEGARREAELDLPLPLPDFA